MRDAVKVGEDFAKKHWQQIIETKERVAKEMLERGYTPDKWILQDNMIDILEGRTMTYECYPVLHKDIKRK